MDPMKETPIRSAVEIKEALLGRHEEELSATRHAMENLAAQVTDLNSRVHYLHREQPRSPTAHYPVEPRVNNPPCYSGEPTECRAFLTQCEVVFSLQHSTYAEDHAKVEFIISLLSGHACDWATALWESGAACCERFELFKKEMAKVFDRSVYGREASRLLAVLSQGKRSVPDYAIEFRTLAATAEWN